MNRMEGMVLSMLKLARIEAGVIDFNIREASVKMIIMEAAGAINYLIEARKQRILLSCDDNMMIEADSEWLTEALINIVKNASDYSGEGTEFIVQFLTAPYLHYQSSFE